MTIQWFPGHMTRARRQIEEKLKLIDVVIELLDARIPTASRNPMIRTIVRQKPRVVILNKADLADPDVTRAWERHFRRAEGTEALAVNSAGGASPAKAIIPACRRLLMHKMEAERRKGMKPRPFRALIVGIPNVGKSTLINRLAGRAAAATGDRPGVTKGQMWIRVQGEMELLDTPGILWPKFDDPETGYKLAMTGAIKEDILNLEDVAQYALVRMVLDYPERLKERFGLDRLPDDPHDPAKLADTMEAIGRARGCLAAGGRIDPARTAGVFLREIRSGRLGRLSFDRPPKPDH
jgi:ribosome biogenesis GTPase A